MISKNTLRNLVSRALASTVRRTSKRRKSRNSATEQLETRALLAVFTVTSTGDGNQTPGSLREIINQANSTPGADEIVFSPSTIGADINITFGELTISETVTITGNGSVGTVINAAQANRIFVVTAGDFTVNGVTLKGGRSTANETTGGAISSVSGAINVVDSVLTGNSTNGQDSHGGAISSNSGNVTITRSTLSGNSTSGFQARGGAIYTNSGSVTVSESTLSGNTTAALSAAGGAIFSVTGAITLSQSTLSGNSTTLSQGGAVFSHSGSVFVRQSTLTGNTAKNGGAIYGYQSQIIVQNSIVAGNTATEGGTDILREGEFATLSVVNSLIGRNDGSSLTATVGTTPGLNGNLIGGNSDGTKINPLLAPLSNNGGPTQTHALLSTSPAIDRGSDSLADPFFNDQRGNPFRRTSGVKVDMGAYERQTVAGLSLIVDTNRDENDGNYEAGDLSLREAIGLANGSIGTNTITFAASLFTGGPASIVLRLGELAITETVTINGPGQTQLSVNANQLSRVLNVIGGSQINVTLAGLTLTGGRTTGDNVFPATTHSGGGIRFDSTGTLTLTNSTVSGNSTTGDAAAGGGIFASSGAVTLTNSTVSGNSTAGVDADGGGIFASSGAVTLTNSTVSGNNTAGSYAIGGGIFASSGAVTLTNSTVSGNSTTGNQATGGGIYSKFGSVTLTNSTVSGNSTAGGFSSGGGISAISGAVTLTNSTVSGNSTTGGSASGGGIFAFSGAVTLTNSTVSGNSTAGDAAYGGGIYTVEGAVTLTGSTISGNQATGLNSDGGGVRFNNSVVTIVNSTITGNSAAGAGGGLGMLVNSLDKKLTIHNSIIAGNTAGSNPDFTAPTNPGTNLEVRHSLIGRSDGTSLTASANPDSNGNLIGGITDGTKINPLLAPLANNGGRTLTHALLSTSPAINRGSIALVTGQTTDQRGTPFVRTVSTAVDMGSYEPQTVAGLSLIVDTNQDENDGNYSAGDLSLREAIGLANGSIGTNTITFAASLFTGGPASIVLRLGELGITESVTINGPGQTLLSINANQLSRVLNVIGGGQINVTLAGLKITGGRTTASNASSSSSSPETTHSGGGIRFDSTGTLTLTNSTVSGNSTAGSNAIGGAIATSSGAVTLTNSTVSGNSTAGATAFGGGIATPSGAVTLIGSTVSGNSTTGLLSLGGGIFSLSGDVTLTNSTISGNSTTGGGAGGGGIFAYSAAVTLTNSTVSGNTITGTNSEGGGVRFDDSVVTIINSTITGNSAAGAGGGLGMRANATDKKLTIRNSIIAGNTAGSNPDFTAPTTPATNLEVRHSLIGRSDGTTLTATVGTTPGANGNLIGGATPGAAINPLLAPLANNGGPTQTRALLTNSPAINRGSNALAAGLTTDQRGNPFARILQNTVDMGAFERATLIGTANADAFVLTYSSLTTSGTVTVTISTNGGSATNLGTFPMNAALAIDGLGGTDSVRIVGTIGADTIAVNSVTGLVVNGASLILQGIENRTLAGGAGGDVYRFDADTALGLWTLDEAGGGIDTVDFSPTTTVGLSLNLATATTQAVHATNLSLVLGSSTTLENAVGGFGADTLTGNGLGNTLNGGAGDDKLNGGAGGDLLFGGLNNDTYIFTPATAAEADQVTENTNEGIDTINFAALTTSVALHLGTNATQTVHSNRTLKLNSPNTFENSIGGSGADSLAGNGAVNTLTGGAGDDTLNGGAGSDLLFGGLNNDTYVFTTATTAEADQVSENTNEGIDTISFAALTTSVSLHLGSNAIQNVHTNRTLKLNSPNTFENSIGGSGADSLAGNGASNTLTGGAGSDLLLGGLNNDTYVFTTATAAEADQVTENTNEGIDTISFAALTTSVSLHLGTNAIQNVHTNRTLKLNSPNTFENSVGGSGADSLAGNGASNTLTGGAGSDLLFGGLNNDTYVFTTATAAEADQVTENTNEGTDTLNFSTLTTSVVLNLGLVGIQTVHTNRTVQLNSISTFENAVGGSGSDTLIGNTLANRLTGGNGDNILVGLDGSDILEAGSGRDILIGGLGLDTLNGGSNDDILIAGRTTSDGSATNLNTLRTEWISVNAYATRVANLRAGVGSPAVSLKALNNVLNDNGEDDSLTGGTGTDWYFRAVDDVITDLFAGELIDVL